MEYKTVGIVLGITLVVLGSAVGYSNYEKSQNAPVLQKFSLDLGITPTSKDIGNITITNGESHSYDIQGPYFNVSLAGFFNYTITFQYTVIYNGISNTTAHVYLQRNLSVTLKTSGSATPGPIYIG